MCLSCTNKELLILVIEYITLNCVNNIFILYRSQRFINSSNISITSNSNLSRELFYRTTIYYHRSIVSLLFRFFYCNRRTIIVLFIIFRFFSIFNINSRYFKFLRLKFSFYFSTFTCRTFKYLASLFFRTNSFSINC